jgi:hypothetical protein
LIIGNRELLAGALKLHDRALQIFAGQAKFVCLEVSNPVARTPSVR